jgi:hypothetical protein
MIQKAVVDRLEGNYAVITIGDGEGYLEALREVLPDGCQEGTWLKVIFVGNTIVDLEIDQRETESARSGLAAKLARLRSRLKW